MPTLYAETDPARQELFLLGGAQADPADMARAAKYLQILTPAFRKTDPPGALQTRLTWPTLVQLRATFGEAFTMGPTLQGWVHEEVERRTAQAKALGYACPPGMVPYPWQVEGARLIAATGKVLITDEPGTGKTITTILGLVEWLHTYSGNAPVVCVAPASVVDSCVEAWNDFVLDEWCAASPDRYIPMTITPFWDVAAASEELTRCAAKRSRLNSVQRGFA